MLGAYAARTFPGTGLECMSPANTAEDASVASQPQSIRILRLAQVRAMTGLSKTTIYGLEAPNLGVTHFHDGLLPQSYSHMIEARGERDRTPARQNAGELERMGPVGFEPTTKGFTLPRCFHREWTISSPA